MIAFVPDDRAVPRLPLGRRFGIGLVVMLTSAVLGAGEWWDRRHGIVRSG